VGEITVPFCVNVIVALGSTVVSANVKGVLSIVTRYGVVVVGLKAGKKGYVIVPSPSKPGPVRTAVYKLDGRGRTTGLDWAGTVNIVDP
jgi:hypothetical protein